MHAIMGDKSQKFCLKWTNYQHHLSESFLSLLQTESMADVTLSAQGKRIHAHRIVLSVCSPLFQELLSNCQDPHPVIIFSEMNFNDICSIVEFVYRGELSIGGDRMTSVLKVAEELKIRGLMWTAVPKVLEEVELTPEGNLVDHNTCAEEHLHEQMGSPTSNGATQGKTTRTAGTKRLAKKGGGKVLDEDRKRRRRRDSIKKEYRWNTSTAAAKILCLFVSEESIAQALEDLKSGRTLVETAIAHNVPRSTLYVRARTQHVSLAYTRQEHSGEIIKAAVQAVVDGASLQKASEKHKIPKTVLWRRVQKELGRYGISHRRGAGTRTPSRSEKRLAAIQALEQGDTLTTVSKQFQAASMVADLKQRLSSLITQIPKTTLFREKTRLVEAGRLPWSCLRKRDPEYDGKHQRRLKDAVTACMEGKMSQATASMTYQVRDTESREIKGLNLVMVPKTTIWRRLHKGSVKGSQECPEGEEVDDPESKPAEDDETEDKHEYTLDLTNQVLEGDEFGETSLIILSTRGSGEEIDLQEGSTIIVSTEVALRISHSSLESQEETTSPVDNQTDTPEESREETIT
uniref:BTB domain-containing protein n=1 Tax=Timema shepardi TaxID=629360 RepID=A0A7R9FYT6_TIMSH|nr:unnamed protein product [Timema shepardi]